MVAPVERDTHYRYKLADIQYEITGTPVQNEYLEGAITRSLDVELYDEPALATNLQADLYQDIGAVTTPQFKGHSNKISASAHPHRVVITNVGPLARLRQCPTRNHNLTGMTDGQIVRYILFHCNINFQDANIQSANYVVGAIEPVYWLRDMPGAELIQELDRIFGMATIEIENGIILRFPYERAPSTANITKTYTVGVDAEIYDDQRARGDLDAITNIWQVTGLSYTTPESEGGDGATRTIWARGEADNPAFNTGDRNRSGSFQSSIIQSQSLAEYVVRRLMRWWNRQPDEITVIADNLISVRPGTVIGFKDPVYGIDLPAGAVNTPYLVLTVDRRGDDMTLQCVGGPAGALGTITSGIEVIQNDDDSPGTSVPPPFDTGPCVLDPADVSLASGQSVSHGTVVIPSTARYVRISGTVSGATGEVDGTNSFAMQGYVWTGQGFRRRLAIPGTSAPNTNDALNGTARVGSGTFETFLYNGGGANLSLGLSVGNFSTGSTLSLSNVCVAFLSAWPY